jgi:hypothetical protein
MALGFCGSREPQKRHLFWTHHYPRCQAADRRHDEDQGDPDRKHFVQQRCGDQKQRTFRASESPGTFYSEFSKCFAFHILPQR